MAEFDIRIEKASSLVARGLIAALDQEILARYPGTTVHGIAVDGFEKAGGLFAVGYLDREPAACGAIRPFEDAIEVKRMFVASAFRNRGLGRKMLRYLEVEARQRGFGRGVLETGVRQPEAIALYRAEGWKPIPVFGPYVGGANSVCFEKHLR